MFSIIQRTAITLTKKLTSLLSSRNVPPVLIHKLGIRDVGGIMNHFDISYGAACNALDYYNKWLRFGGNYYKDYEIRTCELFGFAV